MKNNRLKIPGKAITLSPCFYHAVILEGSLSVTSCAMQNNITTKRIKMKSPTTAGDNARLQCTSTTHKDVYSMTAWWDKAGTPHHSNQQCIPKRFLVTFHLIGAQAEFERDIIRERMMAGLSAAIARKGIRGSPKAMEGCQGKVTKDLLRYSTKDL